MAGLIEIRTLTKRHRARGLHRPGAGVLAVDRVSFAIERGSVFGLVGESGCGKTTLARAILHLDPPTSGEVVYDGAVIGQLGGRALREHRRRMQIVFQDPNGALDPKMRIRDSMEEGLRNLRVSATDRRRRVEELLELVGIPAEHASRWPHEFSGGQKQRIVVARALTMDPDFLVLDEPVSNLDVSIQAQIINLLLDLRTRFNLTYLFISHDLHLVAYVSDRIGVMYRGRLVETADTAAIMSGPLHPYTQRLFASVPEVVAGGAAPAADAAGGEPVAAVPARGACCPYCGQCGQETSRCSSDEPDLHDAGGGHLVACFATPAARNAASPGRGDSRPEARYTGDARDRSGSTKDEGGVS
jgi:oligopeptide/dipeptide ABC transporter ATP-binding protein